MNLPLFLQSRQRDNTKTVNQKNDWNKILDDLQSGKLDPRETAGNLVSNLNVMQKRVLKMALPAFQKFAQKNGTSEESLQKFLTEVNSML